MVFVEGVVLIPDICGEDVGDGGVRGFSRLTIVSRVPIVCNGG